MCTRHTGDGRSCGGPRSTNRSVPWCAWWERTAHWQETLQRIICGQLAHDSGKVTRYGRVGYCPQRVVLDEAASTHRAVARPTDSRAGAAPRDLSARARCAQFAAYRATQLGVHDSFLAPPREHPRTCLRCSALLGHPLSVGRTGTGLRLLRQVLAPDTGTGNAAHASATLFDQSPELVADLPRLPWSCWWNPACRSCDLPPGRVSPRSNPYGRRRCPIRRSPTCP